MKTYFSASKPAGAGLVLAPGQVLGASENMQRIITFIQATNDLAATLLTFHFSKLRRATAGGAAAQKVMLCALTAGIVLNDLVVIQDVVDPLLCEVNVMGAVAANVSYTLVNNLAYAYSAGAYVYGCAITGGTTAPEYAMPVGAATVQLAGYPLLVLKRQQACYVVTTCTATNAFIVSGFQRS